MATHAQIAKFLEDNYVPFTTAYDTWEADHDGQTKTQFVTALMIPFEDACCSPPLADWSPAEGARFVLTILLGHSLMADREL